VRSYYDLEQHAYTPTIFVYPSGVANSQGKFSWWSPGDLPDALRGYALFDAIRTLMVKDYCIGDIYLVGHSLGASIVNSLGCARGEFIRAIVSVAGGMERPVCSGPIAAMLVHNPNDRLVPLRFGEAAKDYLLTRGVYAGTPQPEEFMGLGCSRYREISGAYPLLWCLSEYDTTGRGRYYPHQWPPDMGMRAMAFFDALAPAPGLFLSPTQLR